MAMERLPVAWIFRRRLALMAWCWPILMVTGIWTSPPRRDANRVSVLINNGDGTFQPSFNYLTGLSPRSIAVTDLNSDGLADLVTANYRGTSVSALLGNGNGTFQKTVTYGTGSFPFAITTADFNNDTHPDVIVADQHGNAVSILFGTQRGILANNSGFLTAMAPGSVAVGDLNGDGQSDIVTSDFNGGNIGVLLNTLKPTTTVLVSSQAAVPAGGRVVFTAIVHSTGDQPIGEVRFFQGTTLLAAPAGTQRHRGFCGYTFDCRGSSNLCAVCRDGTFAASTSNIVTESIVLPFSDEPRLTINIDRVMTRH